MKSSDLVESLERRCLLALTTAGPEMTVPQTSGAEDCDLAVAGDGSFLIVSSVRVVGAIEVHVARYSAAGTLIGDPVDFVPFLGATYDFARVAMDADGDAVILYNAEFGETSPPGLYFSRISRDDDLADPVLVAARPTGPGPPVIASADVSMDDAGGFFVGWITSTGDDFELAFHAYDAEGSSRAPAFTVPAPHSQFDETAADTHADRIDICARPDGSRAAFSYDAETILPTAAQTLAPFRCVFVSQVNENSLIDQIMQANHSLADSAAVAVAPDNSFAVGYTERASPLDSTSSESTGWLEPYDADGFRNAESVLLNYEPPAHPGLGGVHMVRPAALASNDYIASYIQTYDPSLQDEDLTGPIVHTIYTELFLGGVEPEPTGPIEIDHAEQQNSSPSDSEGEPFESLHVDADGAGNAIAAYMEQDDAGDYSVHFRQLAADTNITLYQSVLVIRGTEGDDTIRIDHEGDNVIVTFNDHERSFPTYAITYVSINAFAGNDSITYNFPLAATLSGGGGDDTIFGGGGNDRIFGGEGDDVLHGGGGKDRIAGEDGRDHLFGEGGNDRLLGGASRDWLYGNGGQDILHGEGGNDHLSGGGGSDTCYGGAGDDFFAAFDHLIDRLFGDRGRDSALADGGDELIGIESAA